MATVEVHQVGPSDISALNDVIVTEGAVYVTDSERGAPRHAAWPELALSDPAAELSDGYDLNGIEATPDGRTQRRAHRARPAVHSGRRDGVERADRGADVPNVDGLVLAAQRLWAVRNSPLPTTSGPPSRSR